MLFVLFLIVFVSLVWLFTQRDGKKLPPGPLGLPIVGYMPFLQPTFTERQLFKMSEKYGPIMTIKVGVYHWVVISDYQILKELFSKNEFSGRPHVPILDVLVAEGETPGIALASGHDWQTIRRFSLRHLRDSGMGKNCMNDMIQEEALDVSEKIRSELGTPIIFGRIFDLATLNVISNVLTKKRLAHLDPSFYEDLQEMFKVQEDFPLGLYLSMLPKCIFNLIPGSVYGFHKLNKVIKWIKSYGLKNYREALTTYDDNHMRHFIDYYIYEAMRQPKDNPDKFFNEKGFSSVFVDLFDAGMQTTSVTLRYAVFYLAKYPEIQEKIYKDIVSVLGTGVRPTLNDKARLPYIEAFVNELQRVADITPLGFFHDTMEDTTFHGYDFPKGTIIMSNLHALHRDPKLWPNPEKFDPERFIDSEGKFKSEVPGWAPFSLGKRRCPGEILAKAELFTFIANLVYEFTFHPPDGKEFRLKIKGGTIVHPEDIGIIVKQRQ